MIDIVVYVMYRTGVFKKQCIKKDIKMAQCKEAAEGAFPRVPEKMKQPLIDLAEWWTNLNELLEQAGIEDYITGIEMFENDNEVPCAFTMCVDGMSALSEAITRFEKTRKRPSAYRIRTTDPDDAQTCYSSISDFACALVTKLRRTLENEYPQILDFIPDVDAVVKELSERQASPKCVPGGQT